MCTFLIVLNNNYVLAFSNLRIFPSEFIRMSSLYTNMPVQFYGNEAFLTTIISDISKEILT